MIAKIKAYWQSRASNLHALVLFLGGSSGFVTLQQIGVHDRPAKVICGAAVIVAALLFTPSAP